MVTIRTARAVAAGGKTLAGLQRSRRSRGFYHRLLAILLLAGSTVAGQARDAGVPSRTAAETGPQPRERDPFRAPEAAPGGPRPPGLAGVGIMEAVVRGIVRLAGPGDPERGNLDRAIVESESGEGFVAGRGDRLLDGVVGRVEDDGVVFWIEGDPERPVFRPIAAPATDREPEGR